MKSYLRPALHSEIRVALVGDRQVFLQQDLYPALSGGEIVDLSPIPEHVWRDISRDPEPTRSSVTAVLDYQMTGVFNVSVPLDLLDAAGRPDFSAVRLNGGDRRLVAHNTSCRRSSLYPYLQVHPRFSRPLPDSDPFSDAGLRRIAAACQTNSPQVRMAASRFRKAQSAFHRHAQ